MNLANMDVAALAASASASADANAGARAAAGVSRNMSSNADADADTGPMTLEKYVCNMYTVLNVASTARRAQTTIFVFTSPHVHHYVSHVQYRLLADLSGAISKASAPGVQSNCKERDSYLYQYWASGFLSVQRFVDEFIIGESYATPSSNGAAFDAVKSRRLNIQTFPSPACKFSPEIHLL